MRTAIRALAAALLAVSLAPGALAQSYPARPVKIIVPFGAGGPADIYARAIAQRLGEPLGQQVVVEDRPGAGSALGTDAAAKSAPDGHTLLMISNTHAINETLNPKLPYALLRDFVPITQVNVMPNVLVVNPKFQVNSVKDVIAMAKSRPGKLNYASSGPGTPYHLAAELFKAMAGVNIVHIPHKASGEARASVLGGQVEMMFDSLPTTVQQIKAGKLKGLAITSTKRSPLLPEVPTVAEAGVPGYEADLWLGLVAPAGTPAPIIGRLHAEIVKILARPEVRASFIQQGTEPIANSPEQFASVLKNEVEKWGKVVKFSGAKVE
ncbi:MAG: tripartite tricarboxylate transporter substrate binding protein [Betaproteobacteria bacterium]|nr:tripartite tricarboxylate transporter substrate binding protein [Betaproteobacteria bacterium]